ncbi:MAG: hypothetical protein PHI97_05110 [Desulfobulbus sp.]|nr:hypothetical protein [Desulfobulbus sp.]
MNRPTQTKTQGASGKDGTFNIDFPRPAELFPPQTELHIIGVYEGAPPAGAENKPWWANCTDQEGQIIDKAACHRKYASQRVPREVTVYIHHQTPVVLALMSYEPVIWDIRGEETSKVQKVILAGYHDQDIKGLEANTPVDVYTYEASSCRNCRRQSGYFYAYRNEGREYESALRQLKTITGLSPSSFQGSYKANYFSLTPSVVDRAGSQYQSALSEEPVSGRIYSDHFTIAGRQISLPEGLWQTIFFTKVSNTNEEDALISLAQIENDELVSLYAARVTQAAPNISIKNNPSCHNSENFFETNEVDKASGAKLCYWIEQRNTPWQQPLFNITAAKLKVMGVTIPHNVINIGFSKIDVNASLTTYIYANPEVEGIQTRPSGWPASLWNNKRIHEDPKRESFMNARKRWASIWFQFFRLD